MLKTKPQKRQIVVVLTSVTVPVTVPLKTALATVHCPSVSLSATTSAHCILHRKHTRAQKNTNTMNKTYQDPTGSTFTILLLKIFGHVVTHECGGLSVSYNTKHDWDMTVTS